MRNPKRVTRTIRVGPGPIPFGLYDYAIDLSDYPGLENTVSSAKFDITLNVTLNEQRSASEHVLRAIANDVRRMTETRLRQSYNDSLNVQVVEMKCEVVAPRYYVVENGDTGLFQVLDRNVTSAMLKVVAECGKQHVADILAAEMNKQCS